jgi:hypothetical protein
MSNHVRKFKEPLEWTDLSKRLGAVMEREELGTTALENRYKNLKKAAKDMYVQLTPETGGSAFIIELKRADAKAKTPAMVKIPGYKVAGAESPIFSEKEVTEPFRTFIEELMRVYGSQESAKQWVTTPNRALGGRKPGTIIKEGNPQKITNLLQSNQRWASLD